MLSRAGSTRSSTPTTRDSPARPRSRAPSTRPPAPPRTTRLPADGEVGTAATYDIRYSLVAADSPALSEAKFQAAPSITALGVSIPAPGAPGAAEHLELPNLQCVTYYIAIKAKSAWSGWSYVSNLGSSDPFGEDWGATLAVHTLNMGEVNVNSEIVTTSGFVVTNPGNCATTFQLEAALTTPGTPWTLAATPALDAVTVQAVFNSVQPALGDFEDADKLTGTAQASTAARFALDQTGVGVPNAGTRTVWLKIAMPTITSTVAQQDIQVTVRGAAP